MIFYGKTFAEKTKLQAGENAEWEIRRLKRRVAELEARLAEPVLTNTEQAGGEDHG